MMNLKINWQALWPTLTALFRRESRDKTHLADHETRITKLEKEMTSTVTQAQLDAYTARVNALDQKIKTDGDNYATLRQEWDTFKANPAVQALDTSAFEKALTQAETDAQASAQAYLNALPPAQAATNTTATTATTDEGAATSTDPAATGSAATGS